MAGREGSVVFDNAGRRLVLGRLIKSGGAGSVFLLDNAAGSVAKLYHPGVGLEVYERKLQAMLALCPDLPDRIENGKRHVQIAWPEALLRDRQGRFIGFRMPKLDIAATSDLEHVLQERQARAEGLPTGLGPKAVLAANLAVTLAALHRRGHYVVDLKPLNLRFYRESLYIALLDCDGFSVQGRGERFPAGQVTADYLAPEFHGSGVTPGREEQQDRFALAVVVFQLLNSGIHPYSGRTRNARLPTDLPGRIRARLYGYGLRPHGDIKPVAVSGHGQMPGSLRTLFDRAFAGPAESRPSAGEWAAELSAYARRDSRALVACARDARHQHFTGLSCGACARAAVLEDARKRAARAGGVRRGNRPQSVRANRPARSPQTVVQAPQGATAAPAPPPARPLGFGARISLAVIVPVLFGWVATWGIGAADAFESLLAPGFGEKMVRTVELLFHCGVLLLAMFFALVLLPVLLVSRRP